MTSPWPALAGLPVNDVTMTTLVENRLDTLDTQMAAIPAVLDVARIGAASASFTAIADVAGLSVSFTLTAPRVVDIIVYALVQSTIAADRIQLTLADSTNTGFQVTGDLYIPANSSTVPGMMFWTDTLPAAAYTFKVRATRQAGGAGTCIVNAAAGRPAIIKAVGW